MIALSLTNNSKKILSAHHFKSFYSLLKNPDNLLSFAQEPFIRRSVKVVKIFAPCFYNWSGIFIHEKIASF